MALEMEESSCLIKAKRIPHALQSHNKREACQTHGLNVAHISKSKARVVLNEG